MLKINLKKNSPILLISLLLGGIFYNFLPAAQALQITDYPSFLNIREGMNFVELVSSLFKFILLVTGIATFVVIVLGGTRYLASVGDPTKAKDAKDQIFSAIMGMVIVFASWMILNTINPQLVELKEPGFTTAPTPVSFEKVRIPGTCATGETYVVELYSDINSSGDRKCYKASESEEFFDGIMYSVNITGSSAIRFYSEPSFRGENICLKAPYGNLEKCPLTCGAFGCREWVHHLESLKIISTAECAQPGITFEDDGVNNDPREKCTGY